MANEPMKVIATYESEAELETALGLLREAGIQVLTSRDEGSAPLFGQTPYEMAQLAVPAAQADEALRVLAQVDAPLEPGWEQEAEKAVDGWLCRNCDTVVNLEQTVCPECGTPR